MAIAPTIDQDYTGGVSESVRWQWAEADANCRNRWMDQMSEYAASGRCPWCGARDGMDAIEVSPLDIPNADEFYTLESSGYDFYFPCSECRSIVHTDEDHDYTPVPKSDVVAAFEARWSQPGAKCFWSR